MPGGSLTLWRPAPASIGLVSRIRVLLELDPSAEPIGGLLSVDGEPARWFSGWLALARELETALAGARAAQPPGTDPGA
jgi:hypothetical protein